MPASSLDAESDRDFLRRGVDAPHRIALHNRPGGRFRQRRRDLSRHVDVELLEFYRAFISLSFPADWFKLVYRIWEQ